MLRMGRNQKGEPTANDTAAAAHTPQPGTGYNGGSSSPSASGENVSKIAGTNVSNGGSSSSNHYQPVAQTSNNTTRAVTESESLARDIKDGVLSGFVGNGTVLTGEATFKGMLRVDGHLSGRVNSQDGTLIVSTNGQVDANVEVAVAQIYGLVNGDIVATTRIEMGRVARVTGNIQTPALVIENGAVFEGSCRMVQLKEDFDKKRKEQEQRPPVYTSAAVLNDAPDTSEIANASEVAS
ncbi:MAG: polymer-forming cytoskeletal protein [Acidobacteriota bacterium]|nr:polymer-forming cytoskeletal protein [Acidobacteriota bacterium]